MQRVRRWSTRDCRLELVVAALALPACSDALETYPLKGYVYDAAEDCLGAEEVLDVIEGVAEGTCEGVRCFRSEETGTVFITEQCEAPDLYVDASTEEDCVLALEAWERDGGGSCEP